MKIDRRPYEIGVAGVKMTIERMGQMIREGAISPAMRQFAEMVIKQAGVPSGQRIDDRRAAQILLDYVRANVRYRPDQNQVEYVQSAAITLCVPGAVMCIPVGDCDDLTVALGSLLAAYGIQVKLMKQNFGSAEQEHILVIFKSDDGKWLAADPSAPSGSVGWKQGSVSDIVVDPADPSTLGLLDAPAAEFVGVGALPKGHFSNHVFLGKTLGAIVLPGDVLAYRQTWDPYVTGVVKAMGACASSGSQGVDQTDADLLLSEWNLYAGWSDIDVVLDAGNILQSFQKTAIRAVESAQIVQKYCPTISLPAIPGIDVQATVIGQIEGLGILAHGVLQIIGVGAGGIVTTYVTGAQLAVDAVKGANATANSVIPWVAGAAIFIAAAYAIGKIIEIEEITVDRGAGTVHLRRAAHEARELSRKVHRKAKRLVA